jgi:FAD/FMN-containing dehydrogenase
MNALIPTTAVDELRMQLRGSLLTPASPDYDDVRSIWNGMIDRRPALIVRALGTADIIATVRAARALELPLSIRGGGHNIAGLAVCDDGLMLDLSLMRGVWVDPDRRIARVQPGALLGDVDRETQLHGLAAVLGFVSATGVAGLTLGGGFGYLSRLHGWSSDSLRAVDLVTADGRIVRASDDDNADLLWGLRGGGGNFGVATGLEFDLFPLGPEIVAGAIAWPIERAGDVFALVRHMAEHGPREQSFAVALRIAPPAPWIAPQFHGKPIIALFYVHAGSIADGEKHAQPLKQLGGAVGDIIVRRPYTTQQTLIDATQPKGRRYYWKSEFLSRIDDALLERALAHAARITSPHSAVILFQLGGAIADRPEDFSATGSRDTQFVLNITAAWDGAEDDAANIAWARNAWLDMRVFSNGGTYVNFQTQDEGDDRLRAAYGANYDRLVALKQKWDPDNVFHVNRNIAPGTRA